MKIVLVIIAVFILILGGYLSYSSANESVKYVQTLKTDLNSVDFHFPGNQIKETTEIYVQGSEFYRLNILQFADEASTLEGISKMKREYDSKNIIIKKNNINYVESETRMYFYKSGKNIVYIELSGDKGLDESFIVWHYSKYPNTD